jgi:LDH2 family malate/lactate/ureidoglycolate dehydrogenase
MPTVSVDQFRAISTALFSAAGASTSDGQAATESLLWASLRGHDSHGSGHLPIYVRGYMGGGRFGKVNGHGTPLVLRETDSTFVIDADWTLAQKAMMTAVEMAIEKARSAGVAACTLCHTGHTGALGYYTNRIVDNDMIGMIFSCSGAASAPYGGAERMLGTHPMSIGIPAGAEPPIIVDMATSSTTWLGIERVLGAGGSIPDGLVLDDDGEPTTDPTKFFGAPSSREQRGTMASFGRDHKGYAIQLAVEMLGGILPALMTGNEVWLEGRLQVPALIVVVNVSGFQDVDDFKRMVDSRIRQIKASRRANGAGEIYLPGEKGFRTKEIRAREGIPVPDEDWEQIEELATELNVELTPYLETQSLH